MVVQRRGEPVGERAEVAEVVRRGEAVAAPGRSGGHGLFAHAVGRPGMARLASHAAMRSAQARQAAPALASAGSGRFQRRERGQCLGEGGLEAPGECRLAQHLVLARAAFEVHAAFAELTRRGAEGERALLVLLDRAHDRFHAAPAARDGGGRAGGDQEAREQDAAKER